jgi:type I restriction-modification system DNA methylase subunit
MQDITKKEVKIVTNCTLINVFKNCLDTLRDNEGLTGEKALRNLSYFLILKLLEPHFGRDINIDDYDYDFSNIENEMIESHRNKLLEIVRFSNLSNEKEDNIIVNMKYLWDDILSNHPITKNIFLKGKGFDIQRKSTFKKLIDKLNSIDISQTEYDVLGNAYEEVIQDIMTGKVLGQFFTQPLIKKLMVKLINPQIHPDGKIDTCGDPTMGTGGFLITYLQYILEQATTKNIKPDWDFIKTEGLYGKELEPDTYQLAVSNMLISSGHMFESLEKGDSIRDPIKRKFDNILANPPFGVKGLNYNDFQSPLKSEYVPIKTNNAVSLFIQAIIYMLKINGKCAVVLPNGEALSSKINKTLILIREYLMKTCDLKEIIYLPSGMFTYTPIRTCVFYFVKKREGTDVLETKIKVSKTQKETGRYYNFSKTHQTTKVKFYDYNPYEEVKKLLVEVPIDKIVDKSYSLNYAEYMNNDTEEKQYTEGVIVKTLGEVCKFLPKSKRNAKYGNKEGRYPFFKSSLKVDSYVDEPDYQEESLIIGDGGEPNINYGIKFSTSDHCFILQNKNKSYLNLKYAYYYLYNNLDMMKHLYTGLGIKNITKTNTEKIKIPIPSLQRQEEIVKYCEYNDTIIKQLEKEIENNKKQAQYFIKDIVKVQLQTEEQNYTGSVFTEPIEQEQNEIEILPIERTPNIRKSKISKRKNKPT